MRVSTRAILVHGMLLAGLGILLIGGRKVSKWERLLVGQVCLGVALPGACVALALARIRRDVARGGLILDDAVAAIDTAGPVRAASWLDEEGGILAHTARDLLLDRVATGRAIPFSRPPLLPSVDCVMWGLRLLAGISLAGIPVFLITGVGVFPLVLGATTCLLGPRLRRAAMRHYAVFLRRLRRFEVRLDEVLSLPAPCLRGPFQLHRGAVRANRVGARTPAWTGSATPVRGCRLAQGRER